MEFVDSHSHLFSEEFDSDKLASINRALDARVRTILLPNIDVDTIMIVMHYYSAQDLLRLMV